MAVFRTRKCRMAVLPLLVNLFPFRCFKIQLTGCHAYSGPGPGTADLRTDRLFIIMLVLFYTVMHVRSTLLKLYKERLGAIYI
jgi:hypothetical protein